MKFRLKQTSEWRDDKVLANHPEAINEYGKAYVNVSTLEELIGLVKSYASHQHFVEKQIVLGFDTLDNEWFIEDYDEHRE